MKKIIPLFILIALGISCTKEGPGGKVTITGKIAHHAAPIPGATVYIKYGTLDSPGKDIPQYDAHVVADSKANYEFKQYRKGKYYLYSVGFDSISREFVYGGVPINISDREGTINLDIPVTE